MNSDELLGVDNRTLFDPTPIRGLNWHAQYMIILFNLDKSIFFYRKSLPLQKSQAEAWQTTSRPLGFSIMDSAQNSEGIGISPNDVKNSSDFWNIFNGV